MLSWLICAFALETHYAIYLIGQHIEGFLPVIETLPRTSPIALDCQVYR